MKNSIAKVVDLLFPYAAILGGSAVLAMAAQLLWAQVQVRWVATTGTVAQTGSAYSATIQQPAANQSALMIDQIVVSCSVDCVVTQSANGTGATSTVGTIQPLQPSPPNTPLPFTFWTASNVGTGTAQSGPVPLPGGTVQTFCVNPACSIPIQIPTGGVRANYTVTISGITGNSSITFYGRSGQ